MSSRLGIGVCPTCRRTVHPRAGWSIAAVTLDEPVDVAAIELSANGQPEGNRPMGDVAVAPIDVTFKNDGGSVASINQVSATVVESEHILSCLRQGAGGVGVAAEYALKIPRGQLFEEGVREQISTRIDFRSIPARPTVRCNSRPRRPGGECGCHHGGPPDLHAERWRHPGKRIPSSSVRRKISSTNWSRRLPGRNPGTKNVGRFCPRELEKIDNVISVGSQHAKSVDELREAYQRASDPRSVAQGGLAEHPRPTGTPDRRSWSGGNP